MTRAKQLPDGSIIENWTSSPVSFLAPSLGITIVIEPETEAPAFVPMDHEKIPGRSYITKTIFTPGASNLPEPRDDTFLIVPQMVKWLFPERTDLVVPNRTMRIDGKIVGCMGFAN